MYASGEYQIGRRWFAGARYDWSERAIDPLLEDQAVSGLLTYWPSEFSQVRGQYRRTKYAEGVIANELLFQFLFSIGAHGAHVFLSQWGYGAEKLSCRMAVMLLGALGAGSAPAARRPDQRDHRHRGSRLAGAGSRR